eukprot:EG_transcript_6120
MKEIMVGKKLKKPQKQMEWSLSDDANTTCAEPETQWMPRVVLFLADLQHNASEEALLVPVVASWWQHQRWQPLVLIAGDGWGTPRGLRVLRELQCIPTLRWRRLPVPTGLENDPARDAFHNSVDSMPPNTILATASSSVLPPPRPARVSGPEAGISPAQPGPDLTAGVPSVGMPVSSWRALLRRRAPSPSNFSRLLLLSDDQESTDGSPTKAAMPRGQFWAELLQAQGGTNTSLSPAPQRCSLQDWTPETPYDVDLRGFRVANLPRLQELLLSWGLPPPRVQRLQRYLMELSPPACPRPSLPPSPSRARLFYFGVTYPTLHHLLEASCETWARTIPGMVWYSTAAHPLVTHMLEDEAGLTRRMAKIWGHVARHYGGYDWYVRCWEDNYVFPHRMEQLALRFSPSIKQKIGRVIYPTRRYPNRPSSQHIPFVSGGPPSLWSRAAVQALVAHYGSDLSRCLPLCARHLGLTPNMEDVCFSFCARRISVELVDQCGFYGDCPFLFPMGLADGDVSCGLPGLLDRSPHRLPCASHPSFSGPVGFHYVKQPAIMHRIHNSSRRPCRLCPPPSS